MSEFLASIAAFLAVGALGFWIVTIVAALLLIWTIDSEKPASALVLLIIYAAILGIAGSFNVVEWVRTHPFDLLKYAAAYVAIGVGWAWLRWEFFFRAIERRYAIFRSDYLQKNKMTDLVTDAEKTAFLKESEYAGFGRSVLPVRVSRNKSRLILWMTYWPFSAPWTIINEPIKHVFEFCYLQLGSILQARSDRAFKKYSELN